MVTSQRGCQPPTKCEDQKLGGAKRVPLGLLSSTFSGTNEIEDNSLLLKKDVSRSATEGKGTKAYILNWVKQLNFLT